MIKSEFIVDCIVAALLLSPQFSLKMFPLLDGYVLLFLFLLLHTVLIERDIKRKSVGVAFFFILLFILIVSVQSLFTENGQYLYANLVEDIGREMDTYGAFRIGHISLFSLYNFQILSKICLACLFLFYLTSKNVISFYLFLNRLLFVAVIYQACWYLIYFLGITPQVNDIFFSTNFSVGERDFNEIFLRNGLPRFSFGFSEPSFGACFIIVIYGLIAYLSSYIHYSYRIKRKYFIFYLFLMLSTMSTTMIIAILFVFNIVKFISSRVLYLSLMTVVIFSHIAFLILKIPYVIENYPSISFRLLKIADVSSLSINNFLWGVSFGLVYTQPPIYSLYIQMGGIGIVLSILFFRYYIRMNIFLVLLFLTAMVSVATLYNAYILLVLAMVVSLGLICSSMRYIK